MARRKTDMIRSADYGGMNISYRPYKTVRGDLMLAIYKNKKEIYILGPFDNREQRQLLLIKLGITNHRYYERYRS